MVVLPSGNVSMGSWPSEKSWAAAHGGTLESVADESPQHTVVVRSFALAKYDVMCGQYAVFIV
jgi:formylglycine-generating enzyme required for sulfatase activity